MAKKTLKKYQAKNSEVKPTADSTAYYKNQEKIYRDLSNSYKGDTEVSKFNKGYFARLAGKAVSDQLRQSHKGQPGFDENGKPVTAMDILQKMYSTKKGK